MVRPGRPQGKTAVGGPYMLVQGRGGGGRPGDARARQGTARVMPHDDRMICSEV